MLNSACYRRTRDAEGARNFTVRAALEIVKDERLSEFVRERVERRVNLAQDRLRVGLWLVRGGCGELDFAFAAVFIGAEEVDAAVPRDTMKPARDACAVEAVELGQSREAILGDVVGSA
jgi:hypothetical protein